MDIRYIELKTGFNDNGPAWIARVKESRSGKTVYFNGHAFRKKNGEYSNYADIETGEEYWISGVRKDGQDRHWAGGGKIIVDQKVVPEYLQVTGMRELPSSKYSVQEIGKDYPVNRIHRLLNEKSR